MRFIYESIDWLSIKITGGTLFICAITGNALLMVLGGLASLSTIAYNLVRIHKLLKQKKDVGEDQ